MGDLPLRGGITGGFEPFHETAYALFGAVTRLAAHAQIEHESRVVRGKAAEFGGCHLVLAEEFLDGTDQHDVLPKGLPEVANRVVCSVYVPIEILLV
jgi:hypothetical protein